MFLENKIQYNTIQLGLSCL